MAKNNDIIETRICQLCGKEFGVVPKQHAKKFCSQLCKWTHDNKNRILKPNTFYTCIVCGKSVEKYMEPSRQAISALKYCSRKCKGLGMSGPNHPLWGKGTHQRKIPKGKKYHPSGEDHPMWNGGRRVNDQGYVLIYSSGHPAANKRRKTVREHILVMEHHLGRYLYDGEVVHHINGINDDNRIENLMLFQNQAEHKKHHDIFRKKDEMGRYLKKEVYFG